MDPAEKILDDTGDRRPPIDDGEGEAHGESREAKKGNGHDDTEGRARRMGWVPENEWEDSSAARSGRPRPREFKSAEDYVNAIESKLPVVVERNRFLDGVVVDLQRELKTVRDQLGSTSQLVEDLHKEAKSVGQRAYEKAKRELEAKRDAAAKTADVEAHTAAVRELDELERAKPAPAPERKTEEKPAERQQQQFQPSAEMERWVAENPWFRTDPKMAKVAINLFDINVTDGMSEADSLRAVRQEMERRYPDRFENPRRSEPGSVREPGGGRDRKKQGRTFDDLPAEAKAAYARLKRFYDEKKTPFTKEDYLADYQWD